MLLKHHSVIPHLSRTNVIFGLCAIFDKNITCADFNVKIDFIYQETLINFVTRVVRCIFFNTYNK
jgi:hypothetical protein